MYCENCKKETKGLKMTINGEHIYKCYECKHETKYEPEKKPISPLFIMKGSGWMGKIGR